jgi:GDP-4-dehydro-6-deoxy-D-mannose reductase
MIADADGGAPEGRLRHAWDNEKSVPGTRSNCSTGTTPSFQRALITGGSGFVGRYLRTALEERLIGTDLICTTRKENALKTGHWFSVDLTDGSTVKALVKEYRPDLVVHLAAQSSSGLSAEACGETWRVNVGGAITLAEALASHTPHVTVLNISSAEVYGQSFLDGPATEYAVLRPLSVYGRTKAVAEAAFDDILPDTARLITVRPFNHTGPGQDERFVVPSLTAQIVRIEHGEQAPPLRVGNLDSERDFLDVRDVVRAYAELIEHAQTLPMRSVFNVATGCEVRISEILSRLQAMAKRAIPVEQDPARMRASDIPCAVGNASAIHSAIGWTPEIGLDQTLYEILEDMRTLPSLTSAQKSVGSADHSTYETLRTDGDAPSTNIVRC